MHPALLHVLILPKWYPHGKDPQNGSFIAHYASQLSKTHKVSVIFPVPVDSVASVEVHHNGDLMEIRVPYLQSSISWSPIRKMINYYRYRNAVETGVKRLTAERGSPDLIHAQVLIRPALFAQSLSRKWNIPWMLTEHSSEFLRPNALSKLKVQTIGRFCRDASKLVAVSQSLAHGLEKISGRPSVEVIPNIIEFGNSEPSSAQNDKIQMAVVADLVDEIKNISGVLKALARVKDQLPPFSLQIIGEGVDGDSLKALTHQLGLGNVVSFLGRKDHGEVMEFLPSIDFLITNSRSETFSIVTAEAISFGKPVIVTKCGGPEEWFHDEYGIMIKPDVPEELENALVQMCDRYREYPAQALAQSIREQFNAQHVISAYDKLYREILRQ